MMKHCVKCRGLLVQGTETCIICGKPIAIPVAPVDQTASIPDAPSIVPSRQPAAIPDSHIRFVTAPGGKPEAIPKVAPIPPSRHSASIPGPYIRFVTAPGGRRIEDSSTVKSYKTRWDGFEDSL